MLPHCISYSLKSTEQNVYLFPHTNIKQQNIMLDIPKLYVWLDVWQQNVFNTDNNKKCFLSSKSVY